MRLLWLVTELEICLLLVGRSADVPDLEIVICRLFLLWCSVSCK
jgi:hypothetical protein